jgi:hypothetical protein
MGYHDFWGETVSFQLSNNGRHFTRAHHDYVYYKDIVIERLIDAQGPSVGGNTFIAVGHSFVNSSSVVCCVGPHHMLPAVLLANTTLLCKAPPQGISSLDGSNDNFVSISNNGKDFPVGSQHVFESQQDLRHGYPLGGGEW